MSTTPKAAVTPHAAGGALQGSLATSSRTTADFGMVGRS